MWACAHAMKAVSFSVRESLMGLISQYFLTRIYRASDGVMVDFVPEKRHPHASIASGTEEDKARLLRFAL